jgi:uncharacterized glyoxalase superfamily protein PhnB
MKTRLDPIIAVKDVEASATWYQQIFGFKRTHGGNGFAVLETEDEEIILCLHKWGNHNHPSMTNTDIKPGNGLLLYFRTESMNAIYQSALKLNCKIVEDIHINQNSLRREFSVYDPDGYFLTITDFHKYEG